MRPTAKLVAFLLLSGAAPGCGGGGEASPTERLWVSGVPTNPKMPITAFATTRHGDGKFLGAFFSGTMLRGGHDVFEWRDTGKGRAQLKFLQDGLQASIRLETCKPSTGFDHCLLVHGDPTGNVRYQSRKRWVVKRPGRKDAALVTGALAELSGDDPALAAWLEE
jgi:hypothetical protein